METQNKSNGAIHGGVESGIVETNSCRVGELVLRVLALALTLTAAIVIGVDKQTKVVPVKVVDTLPPLNVTVHAKWHYMSAFVYSVVSNAIACAYAAISILLTMRAKKGMLPLTLMILDLIMVALLFSSNGASAAIGLMGYKGNSHVRWNKVCNVFDRFCRQITSAVVLSLLGSFVFLVLVVLATMRLHKKSA